MAQDEGRDMMAWAEVAIAAFMTGILLYWLHSKDRFRTISAAVAIGAVSMLACFLVTGGPIARAIDIFFAIYIAPTVGTLFGLFMFLAMLFMFLAMAWPLVTEKIRKWRWGSLWENDVI